jgi:hypothetical protein
MYLKLLQLNYNNSSKYITKLNIIIILLCYQVILYKVVYSYHHFIPTSPTTSTSSSRSLISYFHSNNKLSSYNTGKEVDDI